MANQYWIKRDAGSTWACGNPPVFQAIRYYSDTNLPKTIYLCAFSEFVYNFYQTKKGRIL